MCGIAGYKCFDKKRPSKKEIEKLMLGIMSRGTDATGVAWIENKNLMVVKKPVEASEFIKTPLWHEISDMPNMMLLHTRAATTGNPQNNTNNHPIFNKDGMALTHNGIILNPESIYLKKNIKPDGEVDSEVILRLLEKGWWKDIENLNNLSGGFACALIWAKKPDELILLRHSNPLALYMDKKRDILFWASTTEILKDSFCNYHRGFMTSRIIAYELQNNMAILVDSKGVKDTAKLNPKSEYYSFYFQTPKTTTKDWQKWIKTKSIHRCEICDEEIEEPIEYLGSFLCKDCFDEYKYDDECNRCGYFLSVDGICYKCGGTNEYS